MKIAVVCANGKAGRLIAEEAVKRGHEVTAVVRGENRSAAPAALIKDIFDVTAADLAGFDAVVDAFGAWTPDAIPQIPVAAAHMCDVLSGSDTRLVIVGGAGSLYTDPSHTQTVADGKDFPDAFKPLAAAHDEALKALRGRNDVNWTYVSPAADFRADGEKTGSYTLAGEELTLNKRGESVISYADYALAIVDEIERGKNFRRRISVVGE